MARRPHAAPLGRAVRRLKCALLLCLAPLASADDAWRLEREADGIRVWTRAVEDSPHRAIRARTLMASPMDAIVAVLQDTEACREWAQFCAEAHVHETIGEEEALIYTRNDLPWPIADRDVVFHVRWIRDAATGTVEMSAVATEGEMARQQGRVRLTDARSHWTLRPLDQGIEVTTEAHVDPGGPVPAWLTNRLLVDAPFRTLQRLRTLAAARAATRTREGGVTRAPTQPRTR